MNNKVLILNPSNNIESLFDFFEELHNRSYKISLLSRNVNLVKRFSENSWKAKTLFFWPQITSVTTFLLTILFLPIILPGLLIFLSIIKFKNDTSTIICFSTFDKIFTTPLASILKIKIIWLCYPDLQHQKLNPFIRFVMKKCSLKATIVVLTDYCKEKFLKEKYSPKKINVILPSIKISDPHQENMFEKMANNDKKNQLKKFFTVGTIVNLNEKNNLETILNSITKTLTVIPNLQFIIIGDGEERKKLNWLSKKMNIENLVWFVGNQKQLKKWFDNFDVFIISSAKKTLFDINNTLKAMNNSLTVLGENTSVWSEIVKNNQTGVLLESFNSESIASEIIRLKQNSLVRKKLGEQAKTQINTEHTIKQMVDKFVKVL